MSQQQIALISFGFFRKDLPDRVALSVSREFHHEVAIREGHLDLSEFLDPSRRQYHAGRILKAVDTTYGADFGKVIGLFSIDLFIPILTYIFGQAMLNGRTGIASIYRLSNERYGISRDDELMTRRFIKEVIHELGHTFGLVHCHVPGCVMSSSTYVEEIDQKEEHLCMNCRNTLSGSALTSREW